MRTSSGRTQQCIKRDSRGSASTRRASSPDRRHFVCLAGALGAAVLLTGHSPYRQWMVYRETHLVILTSRDDPGGDELGERIAEILRAALPDSRAAVGRGPRVERIASLLSSDQARVGVLSRANASAMYRGEPPFQHFGAIALRVIVEDDRYQLVCRQDFLAQHAYLVAEALLADASRGALLRVPARDVEDQGHIPPHAGALAVAERRALDEGDRP